MKTTSKSIFLAALFGVVLTTTLAAMVMDSPSTAAPKGDRLMDSVVGSPSVVVENAAGNVSIVTRPAS